ncbi:hypothetical protein BMS3Abin15_00055 [bacterium BMS3Abin15]|nr:hypothetical protein BMS3Abin15_00055 [bacterium BMS3Abin15]HDZ85033.1 hypothetical protein [Candidatus Moranbacteria bacterium]
MDEFKKYIKKFESHEKSNLEKIIKDPQEKIIMYSGARLNWIGDYLGNKKIKWIKKTLPIKKILFTGTNPDWNEILIDTCRGSVAKFRKLIESDRSIKNKFKKEASFGSNPILVRKGDKKATYKVLDGMHRLVGAVLSKKSTIEVFISTNENKYLPLCEAHTIYDLIRGYVRNARDKRGEKELYHALKLLSRTYGNVEELLRKRFNYKWVPDKDVQKIIRRVLFDK